MNKINKRTLIIIAAILLPIVLLAFVMYSGSPENNAPASAEKATNFPQVTLDQSRSNARNRLAYLENMTPEQWAEEQKIHSTPLTREQALENAKNRLEKLDAMTPEQWEAQPHPRPPATAQ